MIDIIAIGLGGFFGAILRWCVSILSIKIFGLGFPIGTLIVNCVGSFLMGCLYAYMRNYEINEVFRAFMGIGFLGALTTFSTFSSESFLLFQQEAFFKGILNIFLNVFLCIMLVKIGMMIFNK